MASKAAVVCVCAGLLAGCVTAAPVAPASVPASAPDAPLPLGVTARNRIVPLIDAHQHMMGPAAMTTLVRPPSPPAVTVPPDLAALLTAREKGVDDATLDALFTSDAQVYAEEQGLWWTGREKVLDSLANFGAGLRFVPTSFAADEAAGYIAGVLRTASGTDTYDFMLGLRRNADGDWRIASEMKQPIMPPVYAPSVDADHLIGALDDAGIRYATVLSLGYWFGDPDKAIAEADRIAGMRTENDWVIAQSRKYPDRLIPFCGVNPVASYAVAEMERCVAAGIRGIKIHRNSKFDPARAEDLARLKQFFRDANRLGVAMVVHLRGDPKLYIDEVFPEAPDVPIQVAHFGGGAGGWKDAKLFADAIEAGKPGVKNLYLDISGVLPIEGRWSYGNPWPWVGRTMNDEETADLVATMRRIGMDRLLFGSDMSLPWAPTPREWWRQSILPLPLTDDEVRDLADNLPPYVDAARGREDGPAQ